MKDSDVTLREIYIQEELACLIFTTCDLSSFRRGGDKIRDFSDSNSASLMSVSVCVDPIFCFFLCLSPCLPRAVPPVRARAQRPTCVPQIRPRRRSARDRSSKLNVAPRPPVTRCPWRLGPDEYSIRWVFVLHLRETDVVPAAASPPPAGEELAIRPRRASPSQSACTR